MVDCDRPLRSGVGELGRPDQREQRQASGHEEFSYPFRLNGQTAYTKIPAAELNPDSQSVRYVRTGTRNTCGRRSSRPA